MREIALHILDIMQNSAAAQASSIGVSITADPGNKLPGGYGSHAGSFRLTDDGTSAKNGALTVVIEDNGCGMDEGLLSTVTDPFSTTRTTRKVGLGIPLMKASCERSGGSFGITSQKGTGTTVTAVFLIDDIDRPSLGDLAGVITDMSASWQKVDIRLRLACCGKQFDFSSQEAARMLGDVPLSEFAVVKWLREYIYDGIKEIFGGVLGEIVG